MPGAISGTCARLTGDAIGRWSAIAELFAIGKGNQRACPEARLARRRRITVPRLAELKAFPGQTLARICSERLKSASSQRGLGHPARRLGVHETDDDWQIQRQHLSLEPLLLGEPGPLRLR